MHKSRKSGLDNSGSSFSYLRRGIGLGLLCGAINLSGCISFSDKDLESKLEEPLKPARSNIENAEDIGEYKKDNSDRWTSIRCNLVGKGENEIGEQNFFELRAFPADKSAFEKIRSNNGDEDVRIKGEFETIENSGADNDPKIFEGEIVFSDLPKDADSLKLEFEVDTKEESFNGNLTSWNNNTKEESRGDKRFDSSHHDSLPMSNNYMIPKKGSHTSLKLTENHFYEHVEKVFRKKLNGELPADFYFVCVGSSLHNSEFGEYNRISELFLPQEVMLVQESPKKDEILSIFHPDRENKFYDTVESVRGNVRAARGYINGPNGESFSEPSVETSNEFEEKSKKLKRDYEKLKKYSVPLNPDDIIEFLKENSHRFVEEDNMKETNVRNPIPKREIRGVYYPCFKDYEEEICGLGVAPVRIGHETLFLIGDEGRIENILDELDPGEEVFLTSIPMEYIKDNFDGSIFYDKIYNGVEGVAISYFNKSIGGDVAIGDFAYPDKHKRKKLISKGIEMGKEAYDLIKNLTGY